LITFKHKRDCRFTCIDLPGKTTSQHPSLARMGYVVAPPPA
jgi:hypothetical protein